MSGGVILNKQVIRDANPGQFLKKKWIQINLAAMTLNWLASCINYYLIAFAIKYLPGNILLNNTMSNLSEIVGNAVGAVLKSRLGAIRAF